MSEPGAPRLYISVNRNQNKHQNKNLNLKPTKKKYKKKKTGLEIWAADCETDPFKYGRIPVPFIWGAYNGETGEYHAWRDALDMIEFFMDRKCIVYFHNGGKFDLHFILKYIGEETKPRVISGRIAEIKIGGVKFRDSFSIIPTALGAVQKDVVDYSLFEPDVREQHMDTIILPYLKSDCVYLWELVNTFRTMAGKNLTIASTALSFCRNRLGIDPGKSDFRFDQKFRHHYYGGRVEAFIPGISGQSYVYDIKSAYPHAMKHEHPTGTHYYVDEEIEGAHFIELECFSQGVFPIRDKSGLNFPAEFGRFYVTKWEYAAAIKYGLINKIKIIACYHFENEINFGAYVDHWFAEKQLAEVAGDKVRRHVSKIMLNSLYGKLAQNPMNYDDYKIVPPGCELEDGWYLEFFNSEHNYEVHRRCVKDNMEELHGDDWQEKPMYLNVATAASVTGFVRGMLIEAIHRAGKSRVAYCDTDSLIIVTNEPPDIKIGKELGDWDLEGITPKIGIAGKKMYVTENFIEGPDIGKSKLASKGVRLTANEVWRLCEGEIIQYKNEAPTFSLARDTKFIVRNVRATSLIQN